MSAGVALSVLRSDVRRRAGWIVGVAVTVALGGGVALAAVVIAHRTDRAYPDYVRDADVGELSVNPSISSMAFDASIRTLPGVQAVHSSSLLFASVSELDGGTYSELLADESDPYLQVRGSADGGFVEADRPAVTSGRVPSGEREVFVNDDFRDSLAATVGHPLHVGDVIPVSFWWGGLAADDLDLPPDEVIAPIGVEQLRISGFGHLSDEILPDELYPRDRLIVSGDVAARYGCSFDVRPDLTDEQATFQALVPPDCATQYVYYSLQLGGPASDLTSVRSAFDSMIDRLTTQLPPALRGSFGYEYIVQTRADLDAAVRHTTRPTVTALTVFGVVAAIATVGVVALLVTRNLRRDERDHATLLAVGATATQRSIAAASAPAAGALAGLLGATVVAALLSPIGPLGSVRDVDPSPGVALPRRVVLPAVASGAVALSVVIAAIAIIGARRTSYVQRRIASSPRRARLLDRGTNPAISTGLRATVGSIGSWANTATLIGCVTAVSAVVAAAIFGANLSSLVTEPSRYGWPWDVAVITNAGYGMTDVDAVDSTLDGNADIDEYSSYGFDPGLQLDGHPMAAIYGLSPERQPDFPIIDGRMPSGPGEAAIGTSTADRFDIDIGDRVAVETPFFEPESVVVVGTAVLPSLGSFVADRTGLGTGVFIVPAAEPTDRNPLPVSLTAISLRPGASADDFLRDIGDQTPAWDLAGTQPFTYSSPVRPPAIVNVSDMRAAPLVLGGVLALSLVAGLALSTAVSVRERRRELAILRALGFSRRSLYASVWWQVLSMIAIGLIAGIPLGVVAGRYAWRTFADQLGVVPRADVSAALLAAVIAASLLLGVLAAALPARTAARVAPAEVLRRPT